MFNSNLNNRYYKPLTLDIFNKVLKEITIYRPKEFVMYTNVFGMFMFDLQMRGLMGFKLPKFTYHQFKRTNKTVLNLYKKSGNIKILLSFQDGKNICDLRYGATSLGIYNSFEECIEKLKKF